MPALLGTLGVHSMHMELQQRGSESIAKHCIANWQNDKGDLLDLLGIRGMTHIV